MSAFHPLQTFTVATYTAAMRTITTGEGTFECQWAADVDFDGIRLEVLGPNGDVLFDVSVPEAGSSTINTFSSEVPIELLLSAIELTQRDRERQLSTQSRH